jgi:ribosomal protein L37E
MVLKIRCDKCGSAQVYGTRKEIVCRHCSFRKPQTQQELSSQDKKMLDNVELASKVVLAEDKELLNELGKQEGEDGRSS